MLDSFGVGRVGRGHDKMDVDKLNLQQLVKGMSRVAPETGDADCTLQPVTYTPGRLLLAWMGFVEVEVALQSVLVSRAEFQTTSRCYVRG